VATPSRPAPAPARTASAPTPLSPSPSAAPASGGGYAVQVSSRRSEADARAALQRMQSRFASVIGGQNVMVKRVDLGAKGIYYRAMVGPFGSAEEANRVCGQLKAAGGSCFVQRI
jgi:cell division septation protein DedD